ncbi:GNAT family N-acetyltransferase [Paraburkholderia tropica]|uniref:GNAT family N-acetyltransferase n=1 Tax=Paraburkholderia tropica TaxID=92647 RepID=UPI001CC51DE8|nr:GNAT family N-acetyltransferase [Paraburkholderia tropica]
MEDRVELLTERLRLRRARPGDAPVLFKNYTGAQNCSRFLQRRAHEDVARTETMLEQWCITAWREPGAPFSWVISTLDDDEPIGVFVVIPEGHKIEIHFGIGERFWGRGLAVEAARVAMSALWRSPDVQRIWTVCDVENTGSKRVLEKLGFQCEGTLRKWLVLPAFGNLARDCYVFSSMSRREVK